MKKIALFFLLFFSISTITAQTKKQLRKFAKNYYGSVQQGDFLEKIHFINRYGIIYVKVMIHGKKYTFIYDTGALTVISNDLLKELNYHRLEDRWV